MKVIIAGSRDITDITLVYEAVLESDFNITEVVSGKARGVDTLGEQYAKEFNIPIKEFPADWKKLGKGAGFVRNIQMAEYAEGLIAVTNGSNGTAHMIKEATKRGLKVYVKHI